jgi:hypothetical protein
MGKEVNEMKRLVIGLVLVFIFMFTFSYGQDTPKETSKTVLSAIEREKNIIKLAKPEKEVDIESWFYGRIFEWGTLQHRLGKPKMSFEEFTKNSPWKAFNDNPPIYHQCYKYYEVGWNLMEWLKKAQEEKKKQEDQKKQESK